MLKNRNEQALWTMKKHSKPLSCPKEPGIHFLRCPMIQKKDPRPISTIVKSDLIDTSAQRLIPNTAPMASLLLFVGCQWYAIRTGLKSTLPHYSSIQVDILMKYCRFVQCGRVRYGPNLQTTIISPQLWRVMTCWSWHKDYYLGTSEDPLGEQWTVFLELWHHCYQYCMGCKKTSLVKAWSWFSSDFYSGG